MTDDARREGMAAAAGLLDLMDRGEAALRARDLPALEAVAEDCGGLVAALDRALAGAAGRGGDPAEAERLARLLAGLLDRWRRHREAVERWMEETGAALRRVREAEAALAGYGGAGTQGRGGVSERA